MRAVTRVLALVLVFLAVAACSGDGLGLDDDSILGVWELVSVNGETPPLGSGDEILHSATLEFLADPSRCYLTVQPGNQFGDPSGDPLRLTCRYEYEAPDLEMWWIDSPNQTNRGTVEGRLLTFDDNGEVLVFRRQ